jgi:thiol-disulfide isomerase/thioredoxin
MKQFFLIALAFGLSAKAVHAQTPYTSTVDNQKVTILDGIITKYALQNNDAFKGWYGSNQNGFKLDSNVVAAMEASKGKVQYVIFGGTWCEDTQNILPKFFKLQEASGVSDNAITFFAVDRSKKTLGNVADAFKITNVPTIIVMKDGKETGRVVEYGKGGRWDKDVAELVK